VILNRLSPDEARRRAVDRYSDPEWLDRQPHPEAFSEDPWLALRAAEVPLAEELQAMGFAIDSAWELNLYGNYDDAIPLLVEHMHHDYPDRVREGIAVALNRRASRPYWPELRDLYVAAREHDAKSGLANVMSTLVTPKTLPEYIDLIRDANNGQSRILLIRALKRLRDPRGRAFLETLVVDPVLGKEARATVEGRSRSH